jgi:hypothetical protein
VIQEPPPKGEGAPDDVDEARPPWHWVGFGTIATFALWLPLAYVAEAVRHRLFVSRFGDAPSQQDVAQAFAAMNAVERARWTAAQALPHLLAFAAGAFAGGLLIGRFATPAPGRRSVREAALSGVVTALVAVAVSWQVVVEGGLGAVVSVLMPLGIAVGFASWGGHVGSKRRT